VAAFLFVVEAFAVVADFLVVDALWWVEVAAVSFFGSQEVKNAMPMRAVMKNKTGFFIGFWLTAPDCPTAWQIASNLILLF
jgi:hypothetical protein